MRLPIRWFLTAFLAFFALALGLVITLLSFNRMRAASLDAGNQLIEVTGAAINDSFARFRLEISAVLATATGSRLAEARTTAERINFRDDLWPLLESNPLVASAYVGFPNGDSLTLRRLRSGDAVPSYWFSRATYAIFGGHPANGSVEERYWLYGSARDFVMNGRMPNYDFDPRTRPWFEVPANRVTFSAPFVSYRTRMLEFSLSQRSPSGPVFGVDISLDGYSTLLRRLLPTPSALGAIVRTRGNVVLAFSDVEAFDRAIRRNSVRPLVLTDLRSPPLLAAFASARKVTQYGAGDFRDANGRTWLCSLTPSFDANGHFLGRSVLLAVPEDELLAAALRQRNAALMLCLGIVFSMVPITFFLSKVLADPLDALRRDAVTLRSLDFSPQPRRRSIVAELDEFSETFGTMRQHVKDHNDAVSRFIPRAFLETLGSPDITGLRLGDHRQGVMTLLFADMRSFTTLSGNMSPEDTFRFVNSYLSKIGPIVREHGGFVDKYIGDAIMAIFPGDPAAAVDAAIAMQRKLVEYNETRALKNHPPIAAGIGIHRGPLMLGTIGEEERFETTVISEAVHVVTALETLTKQFGSPILASAEVVETLDSSKYSTRDLGEISVEGASRPVTVYEIGDQIAASRSSASAKRSPAAAKPMRK